jgi:hypothetical protein
MKHAREDFAFAVLGRAALCVAETYHADSPREAIQPSSTLDQSSLSQIARTSACARTDTSRLSCVDQTSQVGLPVGLLSHRSARLPAVRAMSSSSIDVSVPSSARRELTGLWRRLTTASTRADSEAAKLILLKALVHASPVVHSAAARFVVRLVVDQRLWTVDEGTEALLNAAAAASAAGSDEGLQSVVKEVGTLAVHRVITSQRGDGIVGAADGRAWQPFLKILKAAPGDLFTHRTTHSPTRSLVCPLTLVRMHTNTHSPLFSAHAAHFSDRSCSAHSVACTARAQFSTTPCPSLLGLPVQTRGRLS